MNKLVVLAAVAAASVGGRLAGAAVLTDTGADFSNVQGGNGYQYGHLNYTYGAAPDPSTFSTVGMSNNASGWFGNFPSGCCGASYPQIFAPSTDSDNAVLMHGVTNPSTDFGDPGNTGGIPFGTTMASDIRYTSTYHGPATISGQFRFYNNCCNETQAAYVFVNGVPYIGNPSGPPSNMPVTSVAQSTLVGPGAGAGEPQVGTDPLTGTNYGPLHTYSFNVTLNVGDTVDWVVDPRLGFYGDVTELTGQIVPEPATAAVLAFGALVVAGRRRR